MHLGFERDKLTNYFRPCKEQGLIINGSLEYFFNLKLFPRKCLSDKFRFFFYCFLRIIFQKIYFMKDDKDCCEGVILLNILKNQIPILKTILKCILIFRSIKDINENFHILHHHFNGVLKIIFHEIILSRAILKFELKSSHNCIIMLFFLSCMANVAGFVGRILSKDNRVHGSFSHTSTTHQEKFFHLRSMIIVGKKL